MQEDVVKKIKAEGKVSEELIKKFFKGKSFKEIREWLTENGLDTHIILELQSTEIALITPVGIIMQVRKLDNNKLGLWGGSLEREETPRQCAVREIFEETRLQISERKLKFISVDKHYHTYSNGDRAKFTTHRYKLIFDYVPEIVLDEESTDYEIITSVDHRIIEEQKYFVYQCLQDRN